MTPDLFRTLVREASQSPSVHNVQPARWRLENEQSVTLFEDTSRRLVAADPNGNDAAISLGAALEGFALAASAHGLEVDVNTPASQSMQNGRYQPKAVLTFRMGAECDPLYPFLSQRRSWRAMFAPPKTNDAQALQTAGFEACTVTTDRVHIAEIAQWNDEASMVFQRDPVFRQELRSWMRLRQNHPQWGKDGLNAEALQLSWVEALGAGFVLGPGFRTLDRLSLATTLLSDSAVTKSASAIAVMHMHREQDPLTYGRVFHRDWLSLEAAGFGAAVLAALADHPPAADRLRDTLGIPTDHQVVSVFRVGLRPTGSKSPSRARLNLDELII